MLKRWVSGVLGGMLVSVAACSNGTMTTTDGGADAGVPCDDAKCKTGNKCIADDKGVKTCRLTCNSNEPSDPTSCPFGFHCVDGQGKPNTNTANESLNYCVKDAVPPSGKAITPATKGQWGALCDARKGLENNADCDSAQGFSCYGISSTDADAFCTVYDCTSDDQCRMGWWCATINGTPNVTSPRSFGPDQVRSVCLPRTWGLTLHTYSAPCKSNLDCPLNNGLKQHCVDPGDGKVAMCSTECTTNKNCPLDAQCIDVGITKKDGTPQNVCVARAGTFGPVAPAEHGKGDFCSPCHSDADCMADALCVNAEKSTERFCTKVSGTQCKVVNNMLQADCPMKPDTGAAPSGVGCTTTASEFAPRDHCVGFVNYGANRVPGCWTATR